MVLAKVKAAQVSIGETTFDCSKVPARFLPPQLHNPCVANLSRKVPSGGGTDPQGLQATGIPAVESEQVYALREVASATGQHQGWERQNPSPLTPGQDQRDQNYSCNSALDNHL